MMIELNIVNIGWFILALIQIAIGILFFYRYTLDKDKRKLMFGFAFFVIAYSHFYETFIHFFVNLDFSDIFINLQYWTFYPLVFAIGIATHQHYLKNIQFNKIFNAFFILSLIFLPIIVLNPIPAGEYAGILAIILGIEIIVVSLLNNLRKTDSFNFSMLLINICYIMGGVSLSLYNGPNSIFAFFLGNLLILFMFLIKIPLGSADRSNISNYFTIQKKLSETTTQLQRTTEKYERLTDTLPEGVLIIDKIGKITYANPESQRIFDIPFSESKGTMFTKYMTKKSLLKSLELLKKVKKGKNLEKVELNAVHRDGYIFPVEVWATPLKKEGTYNGLICVIRDITDRKQAEKNLRDSEVKYRTVFESAATAMGKFGDDGIITLVNNEFEKLTGFSKKEVINKLHWYDLVTDEYKTKMLKYHKNRTNQRGNPPIEYDCDIIDKDSNIKTVHVKIGLLNDESTRIVSLLDITDLKETHRKLQDLNNTLEKKVDERTEQIRRLLKQKDEFIHQLGHDLKNPLGPLVNLLPIINKHTIGEKDKEILKVIQRNVEYMKNLVQKTLELARLNSPNTVLNFERINLKNHIDKIIKQNTYLFEQKHISVTSKISSKILVSVDILRFEELINNLLTNAVKYSDIHDSIVIDGFVKDHTITISVQDNGRGMTDKQLNQVFDEFYKADESRHNIESSGLGMSICKRIVEKHGGQIWAESDGLGKGSTFYFTLPLTRKSYAEISNKIDSLIETD